jgi:hypothetical protein
MAITKQTFKFRGNLALAVYENSRFDGVVKSLCDNNDSFRVVSRPYSTEIIFNTPEPMAKFGHKMQYGGVCKVAQSSDSDFGFNNIKCISEMHQNVCQNITKLIRDDKLHEIKPYKQWPVSFVFKDNWERLAVGDPLWYIDMDNFYPTIAVKLGYLDESVMNKFIFDEYKKSRNIALSKLVSVVKTRYYIDGKLSHTITSNTSLIDYGYHNVIYYGRNFLNYICDKYRWAVIGRDIDNILFPATSKTIIIGKYMNAHGFEYKRYLAYKISDTQIQIKYDGRIKSYSQYL